MPTNTQTSTISGKPPVTLQLTDPLLAEFVASRMSKPDEILRAFRIGVEVLSSSGAVIDTLVVEKSFDALSREFTARIDALGEELDPAAAGTAGNTMLTAVRQEMTTVLALLDPTNAEGPLGRLAADVRNAVQAISVEKARREGAAETAGKLTIKGREFEGELLRAVSKLTAINSDAVENTGDTNGVGASKKGDLLISCAPSHSLKIVIEAKNRKVTLNRRFVEDELRAGMFNRGAAACILAVHPDFADCLGAPLRFIGANIIGCVFDPDSTDNLPLMVAYHYARHMIQQTDASPAGDIDRSLAIEQVTQLLARVEEISAAERTLGMTTSTIDKTRGELYITRKNLTADLGRLLNTLQERAAETKALPASTVKLLIAPAPALVETVAAEFEVVEMAPVTPSAPPSVDGLEAFASAVAPSAAAEELFTLEAPPVVTEPKVKPTSKAKPPATPVKPPAITGFPVPLVSDGTPAGITPEVPTSDFVY